MNGSNKTIDDLTTITKKEANKQFLGDIRLHLVLGCTLPFGIPVFAMYASHLRYPADNIAFSVGSGLAITASACSFLTAYGKTREYISDPAEYMQKYHSKKLIEDKPDT
jgi:hypothetical protein